MKYILIILIIFSACKQKKKTIPDVFGDSIIANGVIYTWDDSAKNYLPVKQRVGNYVKTYNWNGTQWLYPEDTGYDLSALAYDGVILAKMKIDSSIIVYDTMKALKLFFTMELESMKTAIGMSDGSYIDYKPIQGVKKRTCDSDYVFHTRYYREPSNVDHSVYDTISKIIRWRPGYWSTEVKDTNSYKPDSLCCLYMWDRLEMDSVIREDKKKGYKITTVKFKQ